MPLSSLVETCLRGFAPSATWRELARIASGLRISLCVTVLTVGACWIGWTFSGELHRTGLVVPSGSPIRWTLST
jgi:hypothetical protein